MGIIYKITCTANGKYYIGSTVNKNQRFSRHRCELRKGKHKNKNMQASWDKYGEQVFVFEVVETVAEPTLLMQIEQNYLNECVGKPECFNHNKFADCPWRGKSGAETPMWGRKLSEQTKRKLSAANAGENNPRWGKPVSDETKEKIRATNKARPHHLNRHTEEAKAKIAAASKARVQSEEEKAKRRASMKGHEVSTLTRLKISQTLQGEGNFWYGKKRPESFCEQVRRSVVVIDPKGTSTTYAAIKELREATGLKAPTVNRALKSGKPLTRGPFKGWAFKYA